MEKKEKLISSTMVRKCIVEERDWKQYVPEATYQYVREQGIDLRIKRGYEVEK